ncbi:hypothetical protein [Rubrivirga sp.]|uniref:hypothetical protein n=1 Tax=Rubrivirga sp. TaxID=1885344 RepID=UPI003B51DC3B
MPHHPSEVSVFVAWPGDNKSARDRAVRVIGELDGTFHKHHGVRVVAKDWKTHARPAGGNAQTNINNQVGPGDIFVGLLWTRLGMDAGRKKTGFEEEYTIARSQWKRRKSSLMLYLRTSSPPNLSSLDPGQLQAVRDFVAHVEKKYQALYWTYATLAEFERELRRHLTDEIHARLKLSAAPPASAPASSSGGPKAKTPPAKPPRKRTPKKPSVRKPRLTVPAVKRQLTDADRQAFARRALTASLRDFRAAAKAFNASHRHAEIVVKQAGKEAFTVTADANGTRRVTARVRLIPPSWGTQWTIVYEVEPSGYGMMMGGEPYYRQEVAVTTEDDGYTALYCSAYAFADGQRSTVKALDVARLFWDRLIQRLGDR